MTQIQTSNLQSSLDVDTHSFTMANSHDTIVKPQVKFASCDGSSVIPALSSPTIPGFPEQTSTKSPSITIQQSADIFNFLKEAIVTNVSCGTPTSANKWTTPKSGTPKISSAKPKSTFVDYTEKNVALYQGHNTRRRHNSICTELTWSETMSGSGVKVTVRDYVNNTIGRVQGRLVVRLHELWNRRAQSWDGLHYDGPGEPREKTVDNGCLTCVCPAPLLDKLPDDLYYAAAYGLVAEVVGWLKGGGGEVNAANGVGCTLLHAACVRGQEDMVRELLTNHAVHTNTGRGIGWTPLMVAAHWGHTKCVELLITIVPKQCVVDVTVRDSDGASALTLATSRGHWDCVMVLLQHLCLATATKSPLHSDIPVTFCSALAHQQWQILPLLLHHQMHEFKYEVLCEAKQVAMKAGHSDTEGFLKAALEHFTKGFFSNLNKGMQHGGILNTVYRVSSKPRGFTYIFNYKKKRRGAEKDSPRLSKTFRSMGYEVFLYEDLTGPETVSTIQHIQQDPRLHDIDVMVMIILGHGNASYTFQATDGTSLDLDKDIRRKFLSSLCPQLQGKPKLFLVSYCRGLQHEKQTDSFNIGKVAEINELQFAHIEESVRLEDDDDDNPVFEESKEDEAVTDEKEDIEVLIDTITIHATTDGIQSYRDIDHGTVFVTCMCQVLNQYADTHDLASLYIKLGEIMRLNSATTPTCEETLFRKFYFNPVSPK